MNPWYFLMAELMISFLLIIGIIICVILFIIKIVKKGNKKPVIISFCVNLVLSVTFGLYAVSHQTYYKYNDWSVLQNNIHMVEQKYGEFDLGKIKDNEQGRVAYYIYTDNEPIMPDHLDHYYYIEYDDCGVVYNVYDGCQPGG